MITEKQFIEISYEMNIKKIGVDCNIDISLHKRDDEVYIYFTHYHDKYKHGNKSKFLYDWCSENDLEKFLHEFENTLKGGLIQ